MLSIREAPHAGREEDRGWGLVRRSMALLLVAMGGMACVMGKVTWLYLVAGAGKWVPLTEMKAAGWSGTAGFGVAVCLAASSTFAALAVLRSTGRPRSAGIALLLAGGPSLAAWALLLAEVTLGTNALGLR